MPSATRDGVSLYYERLGVADRTPIVFVSGLGVGRWLWHWQTDCFADEYPLLCPDNRGAGDSDSALPPLVGRLPRSLRMLVFRKLAGYSIEGLAADLDTVLADASVTEAHLVGASLGGMIVQQYALDYDRAVTASLLCTTHGGDEAEPIPAETQAVIYDAPDDGDRRETIRHRMRPAISDEFAENEPETIEQILDWRLTQDAGELAREAQGAAGANFDVSDRVSEIDIPTLVLHGTDDRVLPVANGKQLHEKLPDSRLECIEGGSHLFMIEDAPAVNDHLAAFIETHSET